MGCYRVNVDKDGEFIIESYNDYYDEWTPVGFLIATGWVADDGWRDFEELMENIGDVTPEAWERLEDHRS